MGYQAPPIPVPVAVPPFSSPGPPECRAPGVDSEATLDEEEEMQEAGPARAQPTRPVLTLTSPRGLGRQGGDSCLHSSAPQTESH